MEISLLSNILYIVSILVAVKLYIQIVNYRDYSGWPFTVLSLGFAVTAYTESPNFLTFVISILLSGFSLLMLSIVLKNIMFAKSLETKENR